MFAADATLEVRLAEDEKIVRLKYIPSALMVPPSKATEIDIADSPEVDWDTVICPPVWSLLQPKLSNGVCRIDSNNQVLGPWP
jgi:hypothetical protein